VRVALVSRELYPFTGGGIAPIVAAAARQLSGAAEVCLVTSAAHREEHRRLQAAGDPRLPPPGVELVWVEEPSEQGNHMSYMHSYSANVYRALKRHYGARGPDLIEFCDYLAEGFVTAQARQTSAPWLDDTLVCVRLHTTAEICNVLDGYLPDDSGSVAVHDAERFVLRHADRILWPGGDVLATYQRYYGAANLAPGVRIPDAFLAETPAEDGTGSVLVPGETLRLLYVGRMERRKGVQNLVRAVTALDRDDWHLTMLGGDTATGAVGSSLTAQLELMVAGDPRIALLGPVPRAEVVRHLRDTHVVVMPSLWECWPNAAREALLLNRPLLATRVGGLTEMAQPGRSGWLVGDTTAGALRAALEDRLADPYGTVELTQTGRPRDVIDELTDEEALVRRYTALAEQRPRRRRPAPRPGGAAAPLVSIVVPYFRLERYVEATLRSALAQTHPNVEVLLAVDGSLRSEDRRVLDLAEQLGVRVVVQPNSGLGATRNFGISQSRGSYVLPLDADDVIDPEFVSRCVAALEADPALTYVTTWVEYMGDDGTPLVDDSGGYMPFGNWSRLIERNNVGGTCSAVFRRSVFDHGFRYSQDLTSYEDWLLYLDLARAGRLGGVIPERLLRYRVRGASMMREVGVPGLQRISSEVRALARERSTQWVAEPAIP
jgi:glycosyltransferase involved in cell wall biosynthesis